MFFSDVPRLPPPVSMVASPRNGFNRPQLLRTNSEVFEIDVDPRENDYVKPIAPTYYEAPNPLNIGKGTFEYESSKALDMIK
jgi:hypothetical protein